jgi:hypothetical protein
VSFGHRSAGPFEFLDILGAFAFCVNPLFQKCHLLLRKEQKFRSSGNFQKEEAQAFCADIARRETPLSSGIALLEERERNEIFVRVFAESFAVSREIPAASRNPGEKDAFGNVTLRKCAT